MLKKTREILSKLSLRQKAAILTGKDCWSTLGIEEVGLPSVKMSDSPNGIRMPGCDTDVIPSACALASSFSVDTARRAGELLGSEFKSAGLDLILGPAMNLKRSPLCGRNFEYYSEDPHLSGEMAAAFVQGAQEHVGCCVKHFAMNNQETRRMSVDSVADERTMHEMYLSPFRTVVEKASPVSMMSSYNKINGVYASENKDLLVDILRKEWGFKGFVLSDWGAVNDIVASVRARMDLEMPSNPADSEKLVCAVESGELAMRQLDRACADLIDSVLRLCAMRRKKSRTYTLAERKALLCELAADCAVLLKNDGIFPVPKNKKIGVFGFFAKEPLLQGGGSAHVEHEMPVSPLDELKHIYNDVFYCETFGENGKSADFEESLRAAETCDVCLLFCGLPAAYESEGYDRASLALPSEQIEAIEAIAKINPNVAVVLMSGSAVDVSWRDRVKGILECYMMGSGVGSAVAKLVSGEKSPSGRLAETFPADLRHCSAAPYFGNRGNTAYYGEGVFVGYRYYTAKGIRPAYPFGYGLGYTKFAYEGLEIIGGEKEISISVTLKNTGARDGAEVVQLYASCNDEEIARPVRELKLFDKVFLQAGETRRLQYSLPLERLKNYDVSQHSFRLYGGKYRFAFCSDCETEIIGGELDVEGDPLHYDRNSIVGELLRTAEGRRIVDEELKPYLCLAIMGTFNADVRIENGKAIGNPMFDNVMRNMPLRALYDLTGGKFTEEMMLRLINKLGRRN